MKSEKLPELTCDVCKGESGGTFVGVASIPGAPMSIAWCDECLKRDCAPTFIFEHDFVFVAEGNIENLNEWARSRETWVDGKYMSFDEYVKRFTPEDVARQLREFADACSALDSADPDSGATMSPTDMDTAANQTNAEEP